MQLARLAATTFVAFLTLLQDASACSIFMAGQEGVVLAGNNEDFYLDVDPKVWITPPSAGEHGRVCLGFAETEKASPFAQGGLNDAGLFFDAAVTPRGETRSIHGKRKAPENMGNRMLAECASVVEALDWLGRFDLRLLDGGHLLLADATGDGAVAELNEGAMKVFRRKTKNYVAATNFSFADPARGNYPCPRFARIDRYFTSEHGAVSQDGFRDLLASVAVPRTKDEKTGRDGGTLYSNVCDLKNGVIYLYRECAFDKPARLELVALFAKGRATCRMSELFP